MRPIVFKPENRLAMQLRRSGGATVGEALAGADRRLEGVRDRLIATLDKKIEELAGLAVAMDADKASYAYALASEICGLAGTFGHAELSQAADCLCTLLDARRGPTGAFDGGGRLWDAVRVHADALRTLRRPELVQDAGARTAIVEGLRRLSPRPAR